MQNAWNSQNELDAQNQWRQDQLNQQRNLWDAQKEREQLEWDQRRQMHAEDMEARQGLEANRQGFEQREFDRRQNLELNAVGQKIKAKYDATRAIIERDVKDPDLKQKFMDALTADMTGVKFSELTKPPEETVDDSISQTSMINGTPVQHVLRDGKKQLAAVQGVTTKLEIDQHALKIADHQIKAYQTWMDANNARLVALKDNPVELAKYEKERQSMMPQPLDKIKANLMRELQQGEGEGEQAPPPSNDPQAKLDRQKKAQAAQLELASQEMPPLVAAAANRLKAAALRGQTQITPEMQQDADLVRGWKLRNQQRQPMPTAPQPSGYVMPPPDAVAPPAAPIAQPTPASPQRTPYTFMPDYSAAGF